MARHGQTYRHAVSPRRPKELELIAASGWREFPSRLPEQPIFYPVTNEAYAIQIARDWNMKESAAGYVTKFDVESHYLSRYQKEQVGGAILTEYWITAEELQEFNRNIVGNIVVVPSSDSYSRAVTRERLLQQFAA